MYTVFYIDAVWLGFAFAAGAIAGMLASMYLEDKNEDYCCEMCGHYFICKQEEGHGS